MVCSAACRIFGGKLCHSSFKIAHFLSTVDDKGCPFLHVRGEHLSRLQTYFSARYIRKEEPVPKKKTGGVFLAAGSIGPREKAESTAQMLLRQMSCESLGTVYVNRTDKVPVRDREDIIQEIRTLAQQMKG